MRDIPFTQYLLPNGRKKAVLIERPDEIADKAETLIVVGVTFECEILRTGEVSLTATAEQLDPPTLAIEVVPNNEQVPIAVDRVIERAYALFNFD